MRYLFILLIQFFLLTSFADTKPNSSAIIASHPIATQLGEEILASGGNAFDAAIALTAVLSVVEPYAASLAGSAVYLVYDVEQAETFVIDSSALKYEGVENDYKILNAISAAWLPLALKKISDDYASKDFAELLAPAIQYAADGFTAKTIYQENLSVAQAYLADSALEIFYPKPSESILGQKITQTALANTLTQLANNPLASFYNHYLQFESNAKQDTVDDWQQKFSAIDLNKHQPLFISYGSQQISIADTAAGDGVLLALALNVLSSFPLQNMNGLQQVHIISEVMRQVFKHKEIYLDSTELAYKDREKLIHPFYAQGLASNLQLNKVGNLESIDSAKNQTERVTANFSIIDQAGNRVAAILSNGTAFGAGEFLADSGVILPSDSQNTVHTVNSAASEMVVVNMDSIQSPVFIDSQDISAILTSVGSQQKFAAQLLTLLRLENTVALKQLSNLPRFYFDPNSNSIVYESDSFNRDLRYELQLLGHNLREISQTDVAVDFISYEKSSKNLTAVVDSRGRATAVTFTP